MNKTLLLAIMIIVGVGSIAVVLATHDVTDTPIPDIWQDDATIITGTPQKVYKSTIEDCSLVINKADLADGPHDISLVITMICDDEDDRNYFAYDPDTEELEQAESEPGPFDYGIQDVEECDFDISYRPEHEHDFGNFTYESPETIDIQIDCTVDD